MVKEYGEDTIIESISNDFHEANDDDHVHNESMQELSTMVSKIINLRKKNKKKSCKKGKAAAKSPIKFDSMPYEMIAECASFLNAEDNLDLSITNRTIYCATSSPNTLRHLNLTFIVRKEHDFEEVNLNRFEMLESIKIHHDNIRAIISSSYPLMKTNLSHLTKLHLDFDGEMNHKLIQRFGDAQKIPFGQIASLTLENFGHEDAEFAFDAFCELLSYFPNVSGLEMINIHLTDFNSHNEFLFPKVKILPKLSVLDCSQLCGYDGSIALRNLILNALATQLRSIGYDDRDSILQTYVFENLKNFKISEWYWKRHHHSLRKIVELNKNLQRVDLGWVRDTENYNEVITKLLTEHPGMKVLALSCWERSIDSIISFIECGLLESSNEQRDSFHIILEVRHVSTEHQVKRKKIDLYLNRVVNALSATNARNFMVTFLFRESEFDLQSVQEICKNFERRHLAAIVEEKDQPWRRGSRLIVSNIGCSICGYDQKILL